MSAADGQSVSAVEGLPLTRREKSWGPWAVFGNTTSAAVATWCFVSGGMIGVFLMPIAGTITVLAGTLIGVFLVLLAALPSAQRYGVEGVRSLRPTLGARGSGFGVALVFATLVGWNSVLCIVLVRSATNALTAMGALPKDVGPLFDAFVVAVVVVAVFFLVQGGTGTLKWAAPVVTVLVLVLAAVMATFIVMTFGVDEIFSHQPSSPFEAPQTNTMIVLELGVASGLSWWPYVASLTRTAKSTKAAMIPSVLGLGVMMVIVVTIGFIGALVVPESGGDPIAILVATGGVGFGIVGLLFVLLANIGTLMVGAYTSALALKQVPAIDRRLSWRVVIGITLVPVLVVSIFFAEPFMNSYLTFLAFSGVLFAPICGVQIADYFILRKQELDPRSLYSPDGRGAYWYAGGFNLVGFASIVIGVIVFFQIFDPFVYQPHPGFEFLAASLPSAVVAGAVYLIGARLVPTVWASRLPADASRAEAPVSSLA